MTDDLGKHPSPNDVMEEIPDSVFAGNKSKKMLVHLMVNANKEVGKPFKVKLSAQEIKKGKRIWSVNKKELVTDYKGNNHLYLDANKCTTIGLKKQVTDTCVKCNGELSIDARNVRDLVKRKTIETFWGVDQTHIILLLIMGIAVMGLIGLSFYLYTDNQKLNTKLQVYLPPAPSKGVTVAKMILPMVIQLER